MTPLQTLFALSLMLALTTAQATCNTNAIQASTPTADFTDNGNGTVTHNTSGLMWKKCAEGLSGSACATGSAASYKWEEALTQAKAVNANGGFVGYTDWRLPNIKELASIVELQCENPAINASVFPATPASWFWSSSPSASNAYNAWDVNFYNGDDSSDAKSSSRYVRLVRGGQ